MDLRGAIFLQFLAFVATLELKNGAYDNLVIKLEETVPTEDCRNIISNLESTLSSASQYLFSALDSRAFLRSATVLLPPSWPDNCVPSAVMSASGETSDVTVGPSVAPRERIWTQQSLGCGQPGDQIYLGYETLLQRDNTLGRSLIKEFAMYRYGVFEEQGYYNDPIYPMCYYDDQTKQAKVTGCSDLPIKDNGLCSPNPGDATYNATQMVDPKARSSIMFAAEASSVSMFCDDGNHDRYAPTKHNLLCDRRSVLEVVMKHPDFDLKDNINNVNSNQITDTTPRVIYKRQNTTRYVFVIENTKDMQQRESWNYLRLAMRQWTPYVLPDNSEIGLVLTDPHPIRALNISTVNRATREGYENRDRFHSSIPYTPNESMQPSCLSCAIKEASSMLNDRSKARGPATNVIVVIAPGMQSDESMNKVIKDAAKSQIRIATINYPNIVREHTLRRLSDETHGVDFAVFEKKLNVDTTLLTTYFELHNVLFNVVKNFYSGPPSDLPVEIHRREITDDGRTSVTGSFMLEPNMGEPAKFTFFTHNTVTPLIKSLRLTSPSQVTYTTRNDKFLDFKMITLNANISETGTWTYTVEPYQGNPQPHFLQVTASPKSPELPVIATNFRTHRNKPGDPLILLAEVKYGALPVLGAKVEVTVTKSEINGSLPHKYKFELLDTGSGDPDITKGDGVYTKYFSAAEWGHGVYNFEVSISDNGNTAYTWSSSSNTQGVKHCCGSVISSNGVQPISPFQRILPKVTIMITSDEILSASQVSAGRVGDLKVEVIPEDMKARLSWTSPDMAGNTVSRYEVKYAQSVLDVTENFETNAMAWERSQPLPLTAGSETVFTLDMSQNKEMLDKPVYFAIKAYQKGDLAGPISNWVRVLVPSPPPPPTVAPTYSSNDQSFWPNNVPSVGVDQAGPSIAKTMNIGLELILPVSIGFILLVVLLVVYCYFCVVKRRDRGSHKASKDMKNNKLNSNITIVPSSPQNSANMAPSYTPANDIPDPHQVGVPVNNYAYEDETKKRYSLVNQQEQQLIEELKQQQREMPHNYGGVSVISNRNPQPTLSPFNSWSASQLLHEHERRNSPLENMMNDEQMMMNGSQVDHMSINGQTMDHMSLNGHNMEYPQGHIPPPVPPLPAFNSNGYPVNYSIYGVHTAPPQSHPIYQTMQRNDMAPFNSSLQGSMTSVNSGEKKRRNVTMV
ncbi:unnamed protein product [Brassicogethes aeneus]|uniref:VWFA domain-containing protein n=1 Tax=Brassicogethes aeneus TaxID=1431903 RepID=A0A9P0BIN4_BRAAE|nr:unnamed protein product [Brassicogethes aeneus]